MADNDQLQPDREEEQEEARRLTTEPVPDPDEIERQSERAAKIAKLPGFAIDTKKLITLVSVAACALLLGFSLIDIANGRSGEEAVPAKKGGQRASTSYDRDAVVEPRLENARHDPDAPVAIQEVPSLEPGDATAARANPVRQQKSEAEILGEAQRRSTIMAYGGGREALRNPDAALVGNGGPLSEQAAAGAPAVAAATTLDKLRQTSAIDRVTGRQIGNRDMLILAGAFIPCILQTAMDSSLPGYVSCVIPADVYSDSGRVVLLEKGTRVLGEYQGGIARGKYRLFVVWNRAVTPQGIAIDVGSPASDALGRSGVSGGVKNYFWERFGTALLFSAVDGGMNALGNHLSDADYIARVPSQSADTILRDTMQIQPVLQKNQGEEVGIMVARDFDFSGVYNLRLRP